MTRNLKKLICVLLAVTLLGVASAIVLAEINKSADKTSATPIDENAGRIDEPIDAPTDAPVDVEDIEAPIDERIEAKDSPIEIKPASIMEVSPFPTDVKVLSMDNVEEPARITLLIMYGMESSLYVPAPSWFDIPDNYIAGFADMLEGMEFIPVSGDEMVDESANALSSRETEGVFMTLYSEEEREIINITFYRSKEDAVWAPYVRIYTPITDLITEEDFFEAAEELKGLSWETDLYKINPETIDAQLLETVTTMAIGGSLDAYIDFVDGFLNRITPYPSDDKYYSYYLGRFPYANIPFDMIHFPE